MLLYYYAVCVDGRWEVEGILGDGPESPPLSCFADRTDAELPQLILRWSILGTLWVCETNMPSNWVPGKEEGFVTAYVETLEFEAILGRVCRITNDILSDSTDVFLLWTAERELRSARPERS